MEEKDANATIGLPLPPSLAGAGSGVGWSVQLSAWLCNSPLTNQGARYEPVPVPTAHEISTSRARRFFEYCLGSSRFLEMVE